MRHLLPWLRLRLHKKKEYRELLCVVAEMRMLQHAVYVRGSTATAWMKKELRAIEDKVDAELTKMGMM